MPMQDASGATNVLEQNTVEVVADASTKVPVHSTVGKISVQQHVTILMVDVQTIALAIQDIILVFVQTVALVLILLNSVPISVLMGNVFLHLVQGT